MNRRSFLRNLLLAAPAMALDPERLLWVPGAKKIFIPPVAVASVISFDDILSITLRNYANALHDTIMLAPGFPYRWERAAAQ